MFPIRDDVPHRRVPVVTVAIVASCVAVFLVQFASARRPGHLGLIAQFGLVPERTTVFAEEGAFRLLSENPGWVLRWWLLPLFTSMFLHGGWLHLLGNMWFLWIFGDNVEDRLGRVRFLVFYLLCGVAAGALHVAFNPGSRIPTVGASGAIAGVLGAYLLLFPRARVLTLVPFFFLLTTIQVRAVVFLGVWFLFQWFGASQSLFRWEGAGGVAYWAHVGGFVAGVGLLFFFLPRRSGRIALRRIG